MLVVCEFDLSLRQIFLWKGSNLTSLYNFSCYFKPSSCDGVGAYVVGDEMCLRYILVLVTAVLMYLPHLILRGKKSVS